MRFVVALFDERRHGGCGIGLYVRQCLLRSSGRAHVFESRRDMQFVFFVLIRWRHDRHCLRLFGSGLLHSASRDHANVLERRRDLHDVFGMFNE